MDNKLIDPFEVYVRVRPLLEHEAELVEWERNKGKTIPQQIISTDNNVVYLKDPNNPELYGTNVKAFPFEKVFKETDNNKTIFNSVIKQLVDNILLGYNSTAMAYGWTGAGKTHTMFGDISNDKMTEKGVCWHAVEYWFNKINSEKEKIFTTKISYLEIHNEQVIDWLTSKPSSEGIMIVEDPIKGVLVPNWTEIIVKNTKQVYHYLIKGNARRTKGPTGQNQFSSRSHAILEINIEQCGKNLEKGDILVSKMLLVDWAGSERGGKEKGIRREEGGNINRSLLALGNCINILSDKTKKGCFVPYRDSKLTRLLKDSLGGNIATIMIACVSPFPWTYEETHSTWKYATLANTIDKKVTKNFKEIDEKTAQNREWIATWRGEISNLKEVIKQQHKKIRGKNDDKFNYDTLVSINKNISNMNSHNSNVNITSSSLNNSSCHSLSYRDYEQNSSVVDNYSVEKNEDKNEEYFLEDNTWDHSWSKENSNLNNMSDNAEITICFSKAIYEAILNKQVNLDDISDDEFTKLEVGLDNTCLEKIELPSQSEESQATEEVGKYSLMLNFYTKFIDVVKEKIEENAVNSYLWNTALNETNKESENFKVSPLNDITTHSISEQDISRNKTRNGKTNQLQPKNTIQVSALQKKIKRNLKIKSFLKKLLFNIIAYTQVNEIKDFRETYKVLSIEMKELETKTNKFQEMHNSIINDNERKSQEIVQLTAELEKTKQLLSLRDKSIVELESKIDDIEETAQANIEAFNYSESLWTKSMINYIEAPTINKISNDIYISSNNNNKNSRSHFRSTSIKNWNRYESNKHTKANLNWNTNSINWKTMNNKTNFNSNNNNNKNKYTDKYISINWNPKIPTITAFINGNNIYSQDTTFANSIYQLKYNLTVNNKENQNKSKSKNKNINQHIITPSTSLAKMSTSSQSKILNKDSMSWANWRANIQSNNWQTDWVNRNENKKKKVWNGYISPIKKISWEQKTKNETFTEPSSMKKDVIQEYCSNYNSKRFNNSRKMKKSFGRIKSTSSNKDNEIGNISGCDIDNYRNIELKNSFAESQ